MCVCVCLVVNAFLTAAGNEELQLAQKEVLSIEKELRSTRSTLEEREASVEAVERDRNTLQETIQAREAKIQRLQDTVEACGEDTKVVYL